MAVPEIDLPVEDDLGQISERTANFDIEDIEKKEFRDDSMSSVNSDNVLDDSSPIIYHYMTFESQLPHPSTCASTKPGIEAPAQPDLKKYTSPFEWSQTRKN